MITSLPVRYRPPISPPPASRQPPPPNRCRMPCMGETVAEVNEGVRRYAITVRLHPDERERIDDVGEPRPARH
jgi:hypothetical protein